MINENNIYTLHNFVLDSTNWLDWSLRCKSSFDSKALRTNQPSAQQLIFEQAKRICFACNYKLLKIMYRAPKEYDVVYCRNKLYE